MENKTDEKIERADCVFRKTCRICGESNFSKILDLGKMPPANSFVHEKNLEKNEETFPLCVYFCNTCSLLGLRHVVNPGILFKDYVYQTGASLPLVDHFKKLAESVVIKHTASKENLVIEIGSNDGSLLEHIKNSARVLGVDPATGMDKIAEAKGIKTLPIFFSKENARQIIKTEGKADVILANNVIAHIDDLDSVFEGVFELLKPTGKFIFESHFVGNLIGKGGFDQIYHEHLCYFSLHSLSYLAKRFGLTVLDAELVPIHGESIRITLGKMGAPSKAVKNLLAKEKKLGLERSETYLQFSKKVSRNKNDLLSLLKKLKKEGKRIAGYGAPAKGNTLLNYCKITPEILEFITDTTSFKQGLYAPGSHIKVISPEILKRNPPDFLVLLSWNYAKEILERERALRAKGVKFIIPIPEIRIVS